MALIRWSPWGEFDNIHSRVNRLFEQNYFNGGEEAVQQSVSWVPRVDVFEEDKALKITAELPGMEQSDIKVNVENNILTIAGERKLEHEDQKEGYTRVERLYGSFHRSFNLPDTIEQGGIEAKMEKGVLNVLLPKREEVLPKQIEVKIS